jgi:hypothetical protein
MIYRKSDRGGGCQKVPENIGGIWNQRGTIMQRGSGGENGSESDECQILTVNSWRLSFRNQLRRPSSR